MDDNVGDPQCFPPEDGIGGDDDGEADEQHDARTVAVQAREHRLDGHVAALLNRERDACHDEPGKEPLRQFLGEAEPTAFHQVAGNDICRQQDKKCDAGQQDHRTADEADRAVDDVGDGERAAPRGPCLFLMMRQGGDAGHGIRPWQP